MSSSNTLQLVNERRWRRGFANLLRKENGMWWGTRRWWVQSLVWLLTLNGFIAFLIWLVPVLDPGGETVSPSEGLEVFMVFLGFFGAIGVMVLTQGAIVGEKRSGTVAWILSNPVSRSAFILSKLIGNAMGILAIHSSTNAMRVR